MSASPTHQTAPHPTATSPTRLKATSPAGLKEHLPRQRHPTESPPRPPASTGPATTAPSTTAPSTPALATTAPSTTAPSQAQATTPKTAGQRLAWLDALRGIAALCVVFDHVGPRMIPHAFSLVFNVIDPGLYGVLVFFLVSGYIVPASLERKGSLRSFWLSRVFRLFPLYLTVIGTVLILNQFGLAGLWGTNSHPVSSVFAHLFMLGDMLGGSNLVNVLWTLSYEMTFYLVLTALFTLGVHRRSGWYAGGFAAGALLLGGLLPRLWLSHSALGFTAVSIGADALVLTGLAVAVAGHRVSRTMGACLAAATGLTLLLVNERQQAYEGLTILALMFTGTMLFRAERREISRRWAALTAVGVFAVVIAAGVWHIGQTNDNVPFRQRQWLVSVAVAGLTFALGLALRHRRVPRVLAWLGLVSYSIYLVHPVLIEASRAIPDTYFPHPAYMQVLVFAAFFAVLLPLSAVTYYRVEAPMQRLGHRISRRLDARYGPGRLATSPDRLAASAQTT